MRLDKYLKVSRLIKRRTVANEACDAGRIKVNDKVAKASYDVKVGDVIEIAFGDKSVKVEVLKTAGTPIMELTLDLSSKLHADVVQVVGRTIILYRKNKENPRIKLK